MATMGIITPKAATPIMLFCLNDSALTQASRDRLHNGKICFCRGLCNFREEHGVQGQS
jgi:hypothetical protein